MAAARMGLRTALFTLNADLIAQMSCNPAIGGIAKGHLVREVDALGGIMGEVTDAVGIQFRLLNTSRGPAVWSPRAQCDKQAYRVRMREVLESQRNLKIKQAEVADLILENSSLPPEVSAQSGKRAIGIRLRDGRTVSAAAVIVTTGTFLNGLIHCGEQQYPAGRSGEPAAVLLGESLKKLGLRGCRLKTGTPPRLDGRTIDWNRFQEQPGDVDPTPFSFRTKRVAHHDHQICCHIAYTTPETHHIVNAERLALMKPTAYLINTARGPIVDQKALTKVLQERKIAGAGLDVFEVEPVPADEPILKLDNVIVAPHALCWTDQCFAGNGAADVKAVLEVQKGREPRGIVNRDVVKHPDWQRRLADFARRFGGQ